MKKFENVQIIFFIKCYVHIYILSNNIYDLNQC